MLRHYSNPQKKHGLTCLSILKKSISLVINCPQKKQKYKSHVVPLVQKDHTGLARVKPPQIMDMSLAARSLLDFGDLVFSALRQVEDAPAHGSTGDQID